MNQVNLYFKNNSINKFKTLIKFLISVYSNFPLFQFEKL